jgi:hypothetical protein
MARNLTGYLLTTFTSWAGLIAGPMEKLFKSGAKACSSSGHMQTETLEDVETALEQM